MDPFKTGEIILNARKKLNMTQKELANKLFISANAVSKWERGLGFPDISLLIPLSEILNVNLYNLLKGEEMKEEKVEELLKETINYSNKEIKKTKTKNKIITVILFLLLIIFVTTLLISINNKYDNNNPKPGEVLSKRNYLGNGKVSTIEKEDGWVCKFEINYSEKNNYSYTCFNIKYDDIIGFNYYEYDSIKNKYHVSLIDIPGYYNNKEYQEDVVKISEYFYKKQFDRKIDINDLEELSLNKINKEDVVELYNRTYNSKLITKYGNLILNRGMDKWIYEYISYETDNTFIIGYYIDSYGYLRNLYLDLKIGNKKASELIDKNLLIKDDLELYNKLQEVKAYILDNQKFDIPSKYKNDKEIKELKNAIYFLNKNDGIKVERYKNNIRYVDDIDEMENQQIAPKH